jgi:hypothetical protein
MDTNSYLIISNVVTGFVLLMTCGVAIFRRRIVNCPFCQQRISDLDLRTHIQMCNEHNNLYMGRISPALHAIHIPPAELLAVAVPLPPQQYQPKIADL